jgi:hypothetical protein
MMSARALAAGRLAGWKTAHIGAHAFYEALPHLTMLMQAL